MTQDARLTGGHLAFLGDRIGRVPCVSWCY